MNPKSHLPKLPSISELLQHPRVQGMVELVNQSTLASRAAEFFDEVRTGLASRGGPLEPPSLAHLAERFVTRLFGDVESGGMLINAGGVVVGRPDMAAPVPEAAVLAMVRAASEYHGKYDDYAAEVKSLVCRFASAESACVTASFDAALLLAVTAVAGGRDLVIEGIDSSDPRWDWESLAARSSAILRAAARDANAVLLRTPEACLTDYAADDDSLPSDESEFAVSRRDFETIIEAAPLAGFLNPSEFGFQSVPTISSRLKAGADVVVCGGNGLLGGPACGIVAGHSDIIDRIVEHPLYAAVAAPSVTLSSLQASLQIYHDAPRVKFESPIWQLLSTPIANLEHRAQRLAPQLDDVFDGWAGAAEIDSDWLWCGRRHVGAPSWGVRLRPARGTADELVAWLRRRQVVAGACENEAILDLRSVFPRWDHQIAACLESPDATSSRANPVG